MNGSDIPTVMPVICGNITYSVNDTALSTLVEVSELTFALVSCSPLVVAIIFLAIIVIGAKRRLYRWQEFVLTANRTFADIIFALIMVIHYETRAVDYTVSSGTVQHIFAIPGASYITPEWLHFLFTFDFIMTLSVAAFSCILSVYAVKQPTDYDEKMTSSFFLVKISGLMWIIVGTISYLITRHDSHNSMAEKTLHHMQQPNPNGLAQLGHFCWKIEDDEVGVIASATVALAVPLFIYLILAGSLFALILSLWRNHLKTRHHYQAFDAACRLGLHIGLYFVFLVLYLIVYFETPSARSVCKDTTHICELFGGIPVIRHYIYVSMIATIVWLVRIAADPVIDLIGDKRLRKALQRRQAEFDDLVEMLEHNQEESEFADN